MSFSAEQGKTSLLDRVGTGQTVKAYVVGVAFLEEGVLAAALGDGRVAFIGSDSVDAPRFVSVNDGACLSLAVDLGGDRVLTGGDDGRLVSTDTAGTASTITTISGRWVELVTVSVASELRAAAFGKTVRLFARDGSEVGTFDHPNTVGGLAFDPKGRRLATAHYGGASLWWAKAGGQQPKRLAWSGSHLSLTWSPDGKYIVTAMQENELHGWRVADGADMRMSGYSAKVKSMSWLPKGRYLATSGAEPVVCWPFHGKGGPMGKVPLDLGRGVDGVVTVVAAHPRHDVVAAGYEDGATILVQIDRAHPVLVKQPGEGAVTALAWSADGQHLALGTESGFIGRVRLSDWRAPT
ncbi:MAG: WD40 repeat domain-containing protein [Alphaproteobacteria bacterium]|nr:WD40 repeat domain-containing protein [Alphaproteobacteria bacterium]